MDYATLYLFLTTPPISHLTFGALGGLLYLLRQHLKGYKVRLVEYGARPIFGAVAAYVLTVTLGLPNHMTSLFAGYFGIDLWDAAASRMQGRLPFSSPHEKDDEKRT